MSEQIENSPSPTNLPESLFCVNHPQRETYLRCNRCNDPICVQCAVLTPTGYRCKKCISGQQKVYDTSQSLDIPIAVVVSALMAFGGSYIAPVMGFFTLFIAPLVGIAIEEVVRWLVRRRRSRKLHWTIVIGSAVGGSILLLYSLTLLLDGSPVGSAYFLRLLWLALYAFLVAVPLYYRLFNKN